MPKLLMSINPEHVENIFAGLKKYEYRKVMCREKIDGIIIYETAPVKKVVGEVSVTGVIEGTPEEVWFRTSEASGISKAFFDAYFRGKDVAVAYSLCNAERYPAPKELSDYGVKTAPQSFVYVK